MRWSNHRVLGEHVVDPVGEGNLLIVILNGEHDHNCNRNHDNNDHDNDDYDNDDQDKS